jgi:hypothetical protein
MRVRANGPRRIADSPSLGGVKYAWDVYLPGRDLPERLTTDYRLSDGEEVVVGGATWLVERVEIDTDEDVPGALRLHVVPPHEPG